MMLKKYNVLLLLIASSLLTAEEVTIATKPIDTNTNAITVTIRLKPRELLFKDSIMFALDHPTAQLSSWSTDQQASARFDPSFQDTKQSYTGTVHFHLSVHNTVPQHNTGTLIMRYLLNAAKDLREKSFVLQIPPIITIHHAQQHPVNAQPVDSDPLVPSSSLRTLGMYINNTLTLIKDFFKKYIV